MAKKNPNGYGSVRKLSGNRRKPWAAVITTGYDAGAKDISFLREALGKELFNEVEGKYNNYIKGEEKARQEKKYIGYYSTRQEALVALAEYNRAPYDLESQKVTFGQIYDILYDEVFSKMKQSTRTTYTSSIIKCGAIQNMKMKDIRKNHMQDVIEANPHLSKSSQHNILVLFHAIYNYAIENDICKKDYSKNVTITSDKEVKKKIPFTRNEVNRLWENLCNYRMIDAILIMIYTGVRVGELRAIKKSDVHLEQRYIEIWGTKTDAAERCIPIHEKIAPLLKLRLTEPGDCLFTSTRGNPISYGNFREKFDTAMDALEMSHTPHDTRHSFITYATACNLNRTLLKKMVGHATADVTDKVYTHTFVEDLIHEIDKFEI